MYNTEKCTVSVRGNRLIYRMAGNIAGEFNLAVWRMSGQSAKLKSAKHSAHGDFDDLVLYARQIKIRQSLKKNGKMTNPPNIIPANISGHTVVPILTVLFKCQLILYESFSLRERT